LAVFLFVLGVARAVPVLAREVQGAADLLPSRFKGGWPQRAASQRARRAQAAALQGVRHGSAVGDAAAAVKRAVAGVASSAATAAMTGAAGAAGALPSRYKGAWARRAAQRKEERRQAAEAAAAARFPKPEEK
jgi:hypothetical protein